MKPLLLFATFVIFFTTMPLVAAPTTQPSMHPRFRLLDENGEIVARTDQPLSTMRTCGTCHDTGYISSHFYHARVMAEMRAGADMNCFLCHMSNPDNSARMGEIGQNRPKWAITATLAATGLVQKAGDKWTWNASAFAPDGTISDTFPRPRPPTSANCGTCHGQVHSGPLAGGQQDGPGAIVHGEHRRDLLGAEVERVGYEPGWQG